MALPWQHVHLLGIGGTGLSAIARVLLEQGIRVSGCDRQDGALFRALGVAGAQLFLGHDPAHLQGVNALLVTSAVPETHPEVQAARQQGIPVLRRRDFLPYLLDGRDLIAVAGTHGKTTTTGMIVHALRSHGIPAGYIVGSPLPRWGNAAAGETSTFVIEADEYDYMFWGLRPRVAVITNVEWDHVDLFPTPEKYRDAFLQYAKQSDRVVACAEDEGAMDVALRSGRPVTTYGLEADADWRAHVVGRDAQGRIRFLPVRAGTQVGPALTLQVPGRHNVLNALAALAALDVAGFSPEEMAPHMFTYQGAHRRFQHVGTVEGVEVIDDYAHHPTEVRATLAALRQVYPERRVWAVFQPHTYSRTQALLDKWRTAFEDADVVLVMDIYAAREHPLPGLSGERVARALVHPRVHYTGDVEATVTFLREHVQSGDVVVTLGAGTSVHVARALIRTPKGGHAGGAA